MLRRTFLATAAAMAVAPGAFAYPVGLPGAPDVLQQASRMTGVTEGTGPGTIFILFTPWCHVFPDVYAATRGVLTKATLRWIPYSGGQPEGRKAVETVLGNPTPEALSHIYTPISHGVPQTPTPLSDRQDAAMVRVASLIIRDTGHSLATPTFVYSLGSERIRIVPGGLDAGQLMEIAAAAGPA